MAADPIELPSWWNIYRDDQKQAEDRMVAKFDALVAEIERRVTVKEFEAEKRFQNERARLTEQMIESDRAAMRSAIELEKAERIAAVKKEADDRATAIREESKDREDLETALAKAELDRKMSRRWMWGTLIAIGGIFISAVAVILAAEIPRWLG